MPKKLVPNPEYRDAPYELNYQFADGRPAPVGFGPHRFNKPYPDTITNSNQLTAWVLQNSIPSHIEVEDNDSKTIPNPDWVTAPHSELRLNEEQVKALLPKQLVERMED